MSTKVLLVNEWLELKKLEVLKNQLLAASEKIGPTSMPYFNGTWVIKNLFGFSNLIKKKS